MTDYTYQLFSPEAEQGEPTLNFSGTTPESRLVHPQIYSYLNGLLITKDGLEVMVALNHFAPERIEVYKVNSELENWFTQAVVCSIDELIFSAGPNQSLHLVIGVNPDFELDEATQENLQSIIDELGVEGDLNVHFINCEFNYSL